MVWCGVVWCGVVWCGVGSFGGDDMHAVCRGCNTHRVCHSIASVWAPQADGRVGEWQQSVWVLTEVMSVSQHRRTAVVDAGLKVC